MLGFAFEFVPFDYISLTFNFMLWA